MTTSTREFDVVGLGFACLDTVCQIPAFPAEGSKVRVRRVDHQVGGQTYTALGALSRLGHRTAIATCIGGDPAGRAILEALRRDSIHPARLVERRGVPTARAYLIIPAEGGERTVLWHREEAMQLGAEDLPRGLGDRGRVLLLDGHEAEAAVAAARQARTAGVPVVLDGEWLPRRSEELLALVDVAIVSEEFGRRTWDLAEPGRVLEELRARGIGFAAVTLGARGALLRDDEGEARLAPHRVRPVDTTGAGDLFHAGFIHGMLRRWSLRRSAAFAGAFAALSVTRPGGLTSAPREEEALALLGQPEDR